MELTYTQPYYLAASLICADTLDLKEQIKLLEKGGADYIHFDVMDGVFVPRYGLHPEMLEAIKSISYIPIDVHMMVANPEPYITEFARVGADIFVVHAESCQHLHRTVKMIKEAGMKPGVALNPATPLSVLDYVIDDLEWIMLMAINPGIVGHKLIPNMIAKIAELKQKIGTRQKPIIAIDGGVTFESAPKMMAAGAKAFVCGSSTIFKPKEAPVDQKLKEFKKHLDYFIDPECVKKNNIKS